MHSSQSFLTTINRFSDMLSMILEKHNSIATPGLGPKSFDSTRQTLESRNPFRNTASFIGEVQASTYNSKSHGPAALQQKRKKGKIVGKLTSQQLVSRLDNTNEKGVTLLQMYNFCGQTRHLILEYGYLLHKATRFAGFINSHLCLTFRQSQMTFKICNP
jgi:hypothetical protein